MKLFYPTHSEKLSLEREDFFHDILTISVYGKEPIRGILYQRLKWNWKTLYWYLFFKRRIHIVEWWECYVISKTLKLQLIMRYDLRCKHNKMAWKFCQNQITLSKRVHFTYTEEVHKGRVIRNICDIGGSWWWLQRTIHNCHSWDCFQFLKFTAVKRN